MNDEITFWERMTILFAATEEQRAFTTTRYRDALVTRARQRYQQKHQRHPGGLRARRRERRERTRAGYCRHGVYVGGCGVDWMCGRCENGEHWDSSHFSKSERIRLVYEHEVREG